jgi:hypothetical protein
MPKRGYVKKGGKSDSARHKYIKPGTAEDGDRRLFQLKRDLIGMANDGYFDNWPDIKHRVLEGYNPLLELAAMSLTAPGESQRIIAAKIVSEFVYVPLAHSAEPVSANAISIHIEPYARGDVAAIEPPRPAVDVVAADRDVPLHRSSPATPAPTEPQYAEFEVIDGAAVAVEPTPDASATEETVIEDGYGNSYRLTRSTT